jgi:hypothetical protein
MGDDVSRATKRIKNAIILSKATTVSVVTVTTMCSNVTVVTM